MSKAFFCAVAALLATALPLHAQSRTGELRGVWMEEGYGRDWPAVMQNLEENGFNALFLNACSGGAAFYPSKVLPVAPGAPRGRDELAEAVKAARQHGIELHVWRIDWALFNCPPDKLAEYEREGRLMRNPEGKLVRDDPAIPADARVDWLCPSNPKNRQLEKEAMLELVRRYDIAGIQFDYMRYPSEHYCYCDHCREEFEKSIGKTVEHWPADVLPGGPLAEQYADWRRGLETSLVEEISQEAHRIKPDIKVSLAAWPDPGIARDHVFQDWPAWVRTGALDFICFMDYGRDENQLAAWLAAQRRLIHGQIPMYAGLGAFMLKDADALADQIQLAREEGADGFVAFAYGGGDLAKWLPELHNSVTAADPNPIPHQAPPASFAFSGSALLPNSDGEAAAAGERLAVEMVIGTPPGKANNEEQDLAGAEQAAAMLRDTTETPKPTQSWEYQPDLIPPEEVPRMSGRVVLETPQGDPIAKLGIFDSDLGIKRTLKFTAPQGRFRVACYGVESFEGEEHPFVARSPLLIGIPRPPQNTPKPAAAAPSAGRLDALLKQTAARLNACDLTGLEGSVQANLTGEGGGEWWLRISQGKAEWGRGEVENPTATVSCTAEDALALAAGRADPYTLWNAGRLVITGNTGFLKRLADLLGIP